MDLAQLARGLRVFMAAADEPTHLYVHLVAAFLEIARRKRATFEEIAEAVGITPSSVSRVVAALGERHRTGRQGFGWVYTIRDPDEGRRFVALLTPKGEAIARLIGEL